MKKRSASLSFLLSLHLLLPQHQSFAGAPYGAVWAPTTRAERLVVADWNTPLTDGNDPVVAPDPESAGPIGVSLSQSTIDNDFFGIIDLVITGLSLGQTALLEKFKVDNDQGMISASAILQESHLLTDGVGQQAGGVFNFNRVSDVTGRDGRIEAQLDFWEPDSASISGEYVFRVSSPLGSFAAQTVRLSVTDAASAQQFTGTVTSGGQPVADALVALLDPLTGYADFIKGTSTDASGAYTLHAPHEDEFDIVAIKPGFVGPFAVGTEWIIEAGETVTANLTLQAGTRTLAGTLTDPDTSAPLPGVELLFITVDAAGAFDNRLITAVWTDANGQFSTSVTPDRWGAVVRMQAASKIGRVAEAEPLLVVDATAGDATGLTVPLKQGTSIIWGILTSSETDMSGDPVPLCGVEIMAVNDAAGLSVSGVTDGEGNYRLAVPPGRWEVFPFSFSLEEIDHSGMHSREVTITGDNQSYERSLTARPKGGELYGRITDAGSAPIGRLRLLALNADLDVDEDAVQATYQSDGYYCFFLPDGDWVLFPDAAQSATRGLLFKDLPEVTLVDGLPDDLNRDIDVITPTSTIRLTVTDAGSNPLPDLLVHGKSTIGGSVYDSFGQTDSQGLATLPALPGQWTLHVSRTSTGRAGKRELPITGINVTGATASMTLETVDFTNTRPDLQMSRIENGTFKFSGTGEIGRKYFVQGSSDLKDWFDIGSLHALDGAFDVEDASASAGQLFFRVVNE